MSGSVFPDIHCHGMFSRMNFQCLYSRCGIVIIADVANKHQNLVHQNLYHEPDPVAGSKHALVKLLKNGRVSRASFG